MISAQSRALIADTLSAWEPPPDMTTAEWAESRRMLSPESSAEPGKWYNSRTPHLVEPMEEASNPEVEIIVIMSSSQVGKSEFLNNIIGYSIELDPCPMIMIQPTVELARDYSKDRISPMVRDTPELTGLVKAAKSRDSSNTILHKKFPGGQLTFVGANSPAGLASRPIQKVFEDEVDRYPLSAGSEGDPCTLVEKRTATFFNRKIFKTSTPGIKGASRIELGFDESDKRYYNVPCPHCKEFQVLKWENIFWPKREKVEGKERHITSEAVYVCDLCGAEITDKDKPDMLRNGKWIATREFRGVAGFHLWEAYSPWSTFASIAAAFIKAKYSGDPELMKAWVNTTLGQTWAETGESADSDSLLRRCEQYDDVIPNGAGILTVGVDVQDDRLEILPIAWGVGNECWFMPNHIINGDPARQDVWTQLDDYLQTPYKHESGADVQIVSACIDTGGHHTDSVYDFCEPRIKRRIWAVKGAATAGKPIAERPTLTTAKTKRRQGRVKVHLVQVGTDTAKNTLFHRLQVSEPGPGYCHFSIKHRPEFFDQLTAEERHVRHKNGVPYHIWILPSGKRNEALDCAVYALAAFRLLGPVNMEKYVARAQAGAGASPAVGGKKKRRRRSGGIK